MLTIGQKLLLARKRLKLTQNEVGGEIGMTPWTVRRIELGRNNPSPSNAQAIDLWLSRQGVNFDELGNISTKEKNSEREAD